MQPLQPIFTPFTAILFYAGMALMLWKRRAANWFALLWLATATIPSLVTTNAPSTIRMINMLPFLGVPVAVVIHNLSTFSTNNPQLSTIFGRISWITILTIAVTWDSSRTLHAIHRIWPQSSEVQFVWQQSLTEIARTMDKMPTIPTTILGWSPDTMDPPTMELALKTDRPDLRFAGGTNGVSALVLPQENGNFGWLFRPNSPRLHIEPELETFLNNHTNTQEQPDLIFYPIIGDPTTAITHPTNVQFGDELTFIGHAPCTTGCTLVTFWRINTPTTEPRSAFLHATNADGTPISQSDIILPPLRHTQPGDLLIIQHTINPENTIQLRTGIYHTQTWQRLQTQPATIIGS